MTPTILRNFFGKRATRDYPTVQREPFADTRGELVNNIKTCIFCNACALKCPSQCITVNKATAIWEHNPYACVYCSICVEVCPTQSLSMLPHYPASTPRIVITSHLGEAPKKKVKAGEGKKTEGK